jgi:3-hydroxyacyl-CoA dehydrogenase
VKLGLLPGAGGTQRLPRAIGMERALEMMITGQLVPAEAFVGTPLIDRLVRSPSVLEDAVSYAQELVDTKAALRRIRDLTIESHAGFFESARADVTGRFQGCMAPAAIVDCAEAALRPFDEGIEFERARFQDLVNAEESRELRRRFFASRSKAAQ